MAVRMFLVVFFLVRGNIQVYVVIFYCWYTLLRMQWTIGRPVILKRCGIPHAPYIGIFTLKTRDFLTANDDRYSIHGAYWYTIGNELIWWVIVFQLYIVIQSQLYYFLCFRMLCDGMFLSTRRVKVIPTPPD